MQVPCIIFKKIYLSLIVQLLTLPTSLTIFWLLNLTSFAFANLTILINLPYFLRQ